MSLRPASEQLADLRHHARLVVNRARDQEGHLDAFFVVRTAADGLEALIAAYEMDPASRGNSPEAHVNAPSTTKLPR